MRHWLFSFTLLGALLLGRPAAAEPDPIRAGYELFYQGDLRGAYRHFRALAEREPENLAAAYGVLSALYARDLSEESLEAEFEQRAQQLIDRAEAHRTENGDDREAIFYLAQAYGLRAGYRFQRQKNLFGAVRDATKSKKYSEAIVKLEPERADAYIALGLYNYYADIAPSFLKLLRRLLFIPGGDRAEGLRQLEYAAQHGALWAPQAKLEQIQIYGWLEGRVDDAVRLAAELSRAYPDNPEMSLRLARLYAGPVVEDYRAAAREFFRILERAEQGHPNFDAVVRAQALLGLAEVRAQQWKLQEAISLVEAVLDVGVAEPEWALPRCRLARGRYRALLNLPEADEDARYVLAEPKWKDKWHTAAREQLDWIANWQASRAAATFVELTPGNRLAAEGRWELAGKFYEQQRQRHPDDPQVAYRIARLHFLEGKRAEAEKEFARLVNGSRNGQPKWLEAGARLHLARLYDLRGERAAAVKLYREVANGYDEKSDAVLAARVGLVTPYQHPPGPSARQASR